MTFYSIGSLCPSGGMGGYGFNIYLSYDWKAAVALSGIDEVKAQRMVKVYRDRWMLMCGYGHYFDPENCGFDENKYAIPSEETRLSFLGMPRIRWGEWGLEVIEVPGSASGLFLEREPYSFGGPFENGNTLSPHNMDSWQQVLLVLCVFTEFANLIIHSAEYNTTTVVGTK